MRMNITSAAGVLSMLDEPEPQLKVFALEKLNKIVDQFWAEISESIDKIEVLYEESGFKQRDLAALVASKVYYHLGAFEESLTYALGAGNLFNVNDTSEYVETTIAKCIDHYTRLRVANAENAEAEQKNIDSRLEVIVNRMFQRCFDDKQFKQAVGIALETRRIDIFEKAILDSDDVNYMLSYSLKVTMSLIQNRQFRNTVLSVLTKLYMGLTTPDFISVCQCYIFLDDAQSVAEVLEKLVKGDETSVLMAYQIAFDMYDSATQQFLTRVQTTLRATAPVPITIEKTPVQETTPVQASSDDKDKDTDTAEGTSMETDEGSTPAPAPVKDTKEKTLTESEKQLQDRLTKLMIILGGDTTIDLHLQFLIRNNKTDLLVLKTTKEAVRNSVCHSSTVVANAFMHCGTTSDQFLRDNLDWLARATNWAKFTATASLGVIHKGHEKEALNLMSTYLPKDSSPGSAYSEGGGLYALGLIHANHGGNITDYLLNQVKEATSDMVRHGGCLGLGLAAMGTARQDIYEQLKFNLYQDDAVTGEAAGLAMGLVMVGTKSAQAIEDMVAYAQETQHEKILRGLAIGISLTMYGRMEEADALVESLCRDKDPILRWSGMYTIGMAYCGSGNNQAIRKLLHVAVSDVNDDVRRVAVTSLGFLLFRLTGHCSHIIGLVKTLQGLKLHNISNVPDQLSCTSVPQQWHVPRGEKIEPVPLNHVVVAKACETRKRKPVLCQVDTQYKTPEQCPSVVSLLSESYNPHVRFGAAMALGIACAGTGLKEAMNLIEPMTNDPVNYVRQGALIASAMILVQQNEITCPKVAHFRQMYSKIISDKHDDIIAKFGAILAQGIIDAGGRNMTISLQSRTGHSNLEAIVGILVFSQFWFWYPLTHFLSLSFTPTCTIGLNSDLKMPKVEMRSNAKPSTFAYPPNLEEKKEKQKDKVETAILSITAKQKKKEAEKKKDEEKMEVDEKADDSTEKKAAEKADAEKEKEKEIEKEKEEKKKEPEPNFEILNNPVRTMRAQLKVLTMPEGSRYTPMKDICNGGIILMKDVKPGEKEEIVEPVIAGGPKVEEEEEPEPPEPFEWTED